MDSGWGMPELIDAANCGELDDCETECGGDPDCETYCEAHNTDVLDCLNAANLTTGYLDKYGYMLAEGNITKSLAAGTYQLTFWRLSGTLNISGASSTSNLGSQTIDGWVFEQREVMMSSAGTITLSGSAVIDHLGIRPTNAKMTTDLYHPMFGRAAEIDTRNKVLFYEYDAAGRPTTVKDQNKDIVSHTTHHIAGYVDLSENAYTGAYVQNERVIYVVSNKDWTVTDNRGWISVTRESSGPMDKITITSLQNNVQSSRSGTVTISGSGLPSTTISVSQQAAPSTFLNVSTTSVDLTVNVSATVNVSSNVSWIATVTSGSGITVIPGSGSNNGSFQITTAFQQPGSSDTGSMATGTVQVTGGGITRLIQVTYIDQL